MARAQESSLLVDRRVNGHVSAVITNLAPNWQFRLSVWLVHFPPFSGELTDIGVWVVFKQCFDDLIASSCFTPREPRMAGTHQVIIFAIQEVPQRLADNISTYSTWYLQFSSGAWFELPPCMSIKAIQISRRHASTQSGNEALPSLLCCPDNTLVTICFADGTFCRSSLHVPCPVPLLSSTCSLARCVVFCCVADCTQKCRYLERTEAYDPAHFQPIVPV